MKVGLFIPCYVDQCYPNVGLATVDLLERHGVEVDDPEAQTCCGQPMVNSGLGDAARPLAERFLRIFGEHDHVVCPSGSCASMRPRPLDDIQCESRCTRVESAA
jgi:L-lactate dehydrogenase complex protein LldE